MNSGYPPSPALGRRRFVQGLALGGLAAGSGLWRPASALAGNVTAASLSKPTELRGQALHLGIGQSTVNFTGRQRPAITVNGSLPAPILRLREGDDVSIRVDNLLRDQPSSIHWHGLLLPANMDGVPGLSFDGIAPGQSHLYRFQLRQSGTYWYHGHSMLQEQNGLYGAIVIDPLQPPPYRYDREHVLLFSDWTDLEPIALLHRLKRMPDYDNIHQRTVGNFIEDARREGLARTLADRRMWGQMRMTPTDLSDVDGGTYTYLLNGVAPAGNWTGLFRSGEKVLLRLINGSAMTYFDFRIPGLKMTVVAADGQYVHPVTVDELRIAAAETFDVIVEPSGQDAFTLFAQDMGRTGHACGTLAVSPGLRAEIPTLDPRPLLSMADMGHGMHGLGSRMEDPGVGLRDNGRQVLRYADLHSLFEDPDGRAPEREIELRLTGNMERFAWSFDGVPFTAAEPLRLNYGERMRMVLINETMMSHPIHLHGMWSDLEDEQQRFQLRKHTVDMPPGSRRSYRVRADALGRWAFHCHLLYHMETGMMREVRVEENA